MRAMALYKEQGIVLRSHKLGEADKIITIMTQGSGKIRAVAKGIRKTKSRFGARLEPFTHVSLLVYRGTGALDTITQAEIIGQHRAIREDLTYFAAGETMLEAVDKVAEEHERNVKLFLLLLQGLRALDAKPPHGEAVGEAFLMKLLSVSGFHPNLTACAVCGGKEPSFFSTPQGGAVCSRCADPGAEPVSGAALAGLHALASTDLDHAGELEFDERPHREARTLLYAFAEYHIERRMKSLSLARSIAR